MEGAKLWFHLQARGEGIVLDQFSNFDNPKAHLNGTGKPCRGSWCCAGAHEHGVQQSGSVRAWLHLHHHRTGCNRAYNFTDAGPEVWQQTQGRVTHFISSMGTTGVLRCTWRTCSGFRFQYRWPALPGPGTSDHVVLHTGTIMGVSKFLKGQNQDIQIIGLQPKEGAKIPGIRRWPKEYLPKIFQVRVLWHEAFKMAPEPSEQA